MDFWRWPAYAGVVLLIAAALTQLILNYDSLPRPVRVACNGMGFLGQCSLLVFVLHEVVLQVKALLDALRLPEVVTMAVPLLFFTIICAAAMTKIYRLYYGNFLGAQLGTAPKPSALAFAVRAGQTNR
jgi:fucose 4-O-acetylase-like acetyltransferase